MQFDDPSRQTRYRRSLKNDFFRSFAKEMSETGDANSELSDLLLLDVHIHGVCLCTDFKTFSLITHKLAAVFFKSWLSLTRTSEFLCLVFFGAHDNAFTVV